MGTQKIDIEPAGSGMDPATFGQMLALLGQVTTAVPMTKVEFKRTSSGPPPVYTYNLHAVDGRVWSQVVLFDLPSNPGMTFSVPGYWREASEFAVFRPLRAQLIRLVNEHGLVSFKSDWVY